MLARRAPCLGPAARGAAATRRPQSVCAHRTRPAVPPPPSAPVRRSPPPCNRARALACRASSGADIAWPLLAVLGSCGVGGAALGTHTAPGRALSGPVCAMLLAWTASLTGMLLPGTAEQVSAVQLFVVQLATPLLLLGADVRNTFASTGRLSAIFLCGSAATCCGAVLGVAALAPWLAPLGGRPDDAWALAAALCAKNIGGGMNYVAVAAGTHMSAATFAAGLVVDNLAGLCYFPLCAWLGRNHRGTPDASSASQTSAHGETIAAADLLQALAAGAIIMALSITFTPSQPLLTATVLATTAATCAPQALRRVAAAGDALGTALLYVFFATAGASAGNPLRAVDFAPFCAFVAVLYAVHVVLMLTLGRLAKLPMPEVLIASNSNIGGPATAAALADAMGWPHLRSPGLLVGQLGNVIATGVALALGHGVLRGMMASG